MKFHNYVENYDVATKGFNYVSFKNIKNFKSKLMAIGLNEDFVPNRNVIYLYLIKYLGVITKDQLCELTHLLRRDIYAAIKSLNDTADNKRSFMVNIEGDKNSNDINYYIATELATKFLSGFTYRGSIRSVSVGSQLSHDSKAKGLYLRLFRDSDCTGITIDQGVDIAGGMFADGEQPQKNSIKTDAIIKAEYNGADTFLYLELDNGNESRAVLEGKIEKYFNVCLHKDYFFNNQVNYFVFQFDMQLNKSQIWLCDSNVLKTDAYKVNKAASERLKVLREKAKKCRDKVELVGLIKDNGIEMAGFEFNSDTFISNRNRLCNFLSSLKSEYEFRNEELKRKERVKYSCASVKNTADNFRNDLFNEFSVMPFYFDSTDSMYQDITKRTSFAAMYGELDGRSVLLRTNFICGDSNIDKWFNEFLFKDEDWLIKFANEKFGCDFPMDKKREQKYIKLNGETLCFSNLHGGLVGEEHFTNFVLLIPSISASDHARIVHICESDPAKIEQDLGNEYLVVFVATDNEKDYEYYRELASNYASEGRILFFIEQIEF